MITKLLSITNASVELMKRMLARSVFLVLLTAIGFAALELLVASGGQDGIGIVERFPELLMMAKAAAVLTFAELIVFWARFATAHKLDVQDVGTLATASPTGAAIVYAVNSAHWLARILIVVYLMGPV